jgi:O-antigen/teichoic acid export membrane protein
VNAASPLRRALALLPRGTLPVGAGLAVLGLASYVHLAVAGHALSTAGMSSLSVLWSIVFSVGLGLFFPIEQEVTRLVAARRVAGDGAAPVLRGGALLAAGVLAGTGVLMLAFSPVLADRLFLGERAMVAWLAAGFLGQAVATPVRGVLAGSGRFAAYGTQLGLDGALRIALAAGLGLAGVHSPGGYAAILAVAPVLATLAVAGPTRAALAAGSALPWPAFLAGAGPLTVSTLLSQVMVNVAVVDVRLLAPADQALAGALLSALVLARVPLFVFGSVQASLLSGLSTAAAAGRIAEFRHLLRRVCAVVVALAVAAGIPAVLLGPWLVRVLFDAPDVLGRADFALLAVATGAYLLAQVLGQGVLALGRHRDQALAWLAGTLALALVTAVPGAPRTRVEWAYLAGTAVTAALLGLAVARRTPHPAPAAPAPVVLLGGSE